MTRSNARLKAAQARWELNLTVLQEEERRLFSMPEEEAREPGSVPPEMLDRLKAARSQCNDAFRLLMAALEKRMHQVGTHEEPGRGHGA